MLVYIVIIIFYFDDRGSSPDGKNLWAHSLVEVKFLLGEVFSVLGVALFVLYVVAAGTTSRGTIHCRTWQWLALSSSPALPGFFWYNRELPY